MPADISQSNFETAYQEIINRARKQIPQPTPTTITTDEGKFSWWEYSPYRTVVSDGSVPVVLQYGD